MVHSSQDIPLEAIPIDDNGIKLKEEMECTPF
jgi:hypothetical protein